MRKLFTLVGIELIIILAFTLPVGSSQCYRSRDDPLLILSENSGQDLLDFPVEVTFGQNETPQFDEDGMLAPDIIMIDEEVETSSHMQYSNITNAKRIFKTGSTPRTSNSYPVHNLNTGLNYTTIQQAIDAPETLDGHTIFVEEGTFYENVAVDKSISLMGENRSTTIIDGSGTGTVVRITASNVSVTDFTIQRGREWVFDSGIEVVNGSNGNKISNNVIANNGIGIDVVASNNNMIMNNDISNDTAGIRLSWSFNNTIIGNRLTNSSDELGCGLRIRFSYNFTVIGNTAMYNRYVGIFLVGSGNITLRNNNMASNTYNFGVLGDTLSHFLNDVDLSNTVDGKPIYYLINQRDLVIDPASFPHIGYLALVNSTNISVKDLDLTGNRDSVILAYATNSTVINVNASETSMGIQLIRSVNSSIRGCYSNNNMYRGIAAVLSSNISIIGNRIHSSGHRGISLIRSNESRVSQNVIVQSADESVYLSRSHNIDVTENFIVESKAESILLHRSENNTFYHNNFINNADKPRFLWKLNNTWDLGGEGNYWSYYEGIDANGDGIGDTPYVIDEENQDNYPLMHVRIEALEGLIEAVDSWNLQGGIEKSLISKLQAAQRSLDKENYKASMRQLTAFINHVRGLKGKKLTNEQANYAATRISEAQRIIDLIRE